MTTSQVPWLSTCRARLLTILLHDSHIHTNAYFDRNVSLFIPHTHLKNACNTRLETPGSPRKNKLPIYAVDGILERPCIGMASVRPRCTFRSIAASLSQVSQLQCHGKDRGGHMCKGRHPFFLGFQPMAFFDHDGNFDSLTKSGRIGSILLCWSLG